MTTRCRDCGRPLTRPSLDGLGPVCRRKYAASRSGLGSGASPAVLDHDGLAAAGQTTIPMTEFADTVPARRRCGRGTTTLPDVATHQPTGDQ